MDAKRAAEVLRRQPNWERMVKLSPMSDLGNAGDMGAQALEAWAWVERTGHAPEGCGKEWQAYGVNSYGEGPTPLAAVVDAMEKEGNG